MFAYIVRRLVLMLVTLIGISIIIFVLLRVVPGNIVDILFDAEAGELRLIMGREAQAEADDSHLEEEEPPVQQQALALPKSDAGVTQEQLEALAKILSTTKTAVVEQAIAKLYDSTKA